MLLHAESYAWANQNQVAPGARMYVITQSLSKLLAFDMFLFSTMIPINSPVLMKWVMSSLLIVCTSSKTAKRLLFFEEDIPSAPTSRTASAWSPDDLREHLESNLVKKKWVSKDPLL